MKPRIFIVLTVLAILLVSCGPEPASPTALPIVTEEPSIPVTGVAVVESVELQIMESDPIQVNAVIRGESPDAGCTTISAVDQVRDGDTFKLTLTTTTDPLALCAQALTPFEQIVALDVKDLPAAKYFVTVNGIEQSFELVTRDLTRFKQELVEALNARNFELVRIMLDESLTIAHWRSEGTAYQAESAIEQLQLNYINATTLITADPNAYLTTMPTGADPLSVFGIDVGPNFALLVSGWGPDGKDEAILYMNYLLDGSLYWHGVLVAKGGFAQLDDSSQPEDANAYPASVQYVMAQTDIMVYGGPSSNHAVVGSVFSGQIAQVTGTSSNGSWWRIVCPDDSSGSCWVTADPAFTQPTQSPLPVQ